MFKYKKVMIATFTLYFLSLSIHTIFACLNLAGQQMLTAVLCGSVMFVVPIVIFATGKLRSFMPLILTTFYIAASFVMSVFNKTAIYLPLLFACETIISGFFLSSKLCAWLLLLSDVVLVLNGALFLPPDGTTITSYIIMCLCYNFSALGMAIFVYALQTKLYTIGKKNKELSRSNDRKNIFWAASASKMRSSAEAVSEITTSILARNDISVPVREKLREIQTDTGRLLMTLNDAEDYAKIESRDMVLSREPYSFGSLVSDIANFCSAACTNKNVSFSLDCQEDIPSVLIGDSRRISQIVMNLFGNAVKYTENGIVTVSFTARQSEEGIAYLRIQVTDTGTGITPDAAKKIFTVYAEKKGEAPSIHLGLGMVKQLVTLMGGFVFAGREKSGGACFTVTIPQEIQNSRPFAAVEQPEKLRVLLYLKNDGSAEAAQAQLNRLGISSRICTSRSDFMQEKDNSGFTHIFVDYGFYLFDKPIFTMLSRRLRVVALCSFGDRDENISLIQKNIKVVFKPVHLAMLASVFGSTADSGQSQIEFTAPDARILISGDNTEPLKALSVYGIKAVYVQKNDIIRELEKEDYDIIFLGDNTSGSAARILCMDGERLSDLPVISVGERSDGCSAVLPRGFSQLDLARLLLNWLPEEKIRYGEVNPSVSEASGYFELDPTRGIFNAGGKKSAYKEMLEIFSDRIDDLAVKLNDCISAGDFEGCIIRLGSVKDVISGIGAVSAAEIARQTAAAAHKQDTPLLIELSRLFKTKLERLKEDIDRYCNSNDIKPLTKDVIEKAYQHLKSAAESDNKGLALQITEELLSFYMRFSQRLILRSVHDSINGNNYEKALLQYERLMDYKEEGRTQ